MMSDVMTRGEQLIKDLHGHVLAVMAQADETQPKGAGLTNRALEVRRGLEVELDRHRGWIVWTILQSLVERGEVLKLGRRYRVAAPPKCGSRQR